MISIFTIAHFFVVSTTFNYKIFFTKNKHLSLATERILFLLTLFSTLHPGNTYGSMKDMEIKRIALIGIGTKGTVLVKSFILKGKDVVLYDVNETLLRRSVESIKNDLRKTVQQREMTPETMQDALNHIKTKTSLHDLGNCDIIIETIPDDIRIKKDLFKHLDNNAQPSTLLVTTSSLFTVSSVASLAKRHERIVGLHFYPSVPSSTIVEVVPHLRANSDAIKKAITIVTLLDKTPLLVKDSPGFLIERLLVSWYTEALRLVEEEVAEPQQVDTIVATNFCSSFQPFRHMDERGLDMVWQSAYQLFVQRFHDPRFQPSQLLQRMVDSGFYGQKSKNGFYTYNEE